MKEEGLEGGGQGVSALVVRSGKGLTANGLIAVSLEVTCGSR